MKRLGILLLPLLALSLLLPASAPADGAAAAAAKAPHPGFERMKSLLGTWEMKGEDGKVTTLTYSVVSNGTAILETMDAAGEKAAMITVYHPDREALMMTHYCGADNQPRMRCAKPAKDAGSLAFEFVDATNLAAPEAGHMHGLVITFVDADHITQEWTWTGKGKSTPELFRFERKRS